MIERPSMEYLNNLREYPFGEDTPEEDGLEIEAKKRLLISIDWEKAREKLSSEELSLDGFQILYQVDLTPEIEFIIKRDSGRSIIFLVNTKGESRPNQELAEFMFHFDYGNKSIELVHRLLREKGRQAGLKASNILEEAENYIRFFLNFRKTQSDYDSFVIDTCQINVINLALGNGYDFIDDSNKELFEKILKGENKNFVITDEFKDADGAYGSLVIEKSEIENLRHAKKKGIFSDRYYLSGFSLAKDIWTEEETEGEN